MCSLYTAGLGQLDVTTTISAGTGANISWFHLVDKVCPCVNYAIRINGVDQFNDLPCDQGSIVIRSENLLNCDVNDVSVIPQSAHPSIGLLENLSGHTEFLYGPSGMCLLQP